MGRTRIIARLVDGPLVGGEAAADEGVPAGIDDEVAVVAS
jgi:hypothetical protein